MPEIVTFEQLTQALNIDYTIWRRNNAMLGLRKALEPYMNTSPRIESAYFMLQPERVNISASRTIASWVRDATIRGDRDIPIHFKVNEREITFIPSQFPVNDLMEIHSRGYVTEDKTYPYNGSNADAYVCYAIQLIRDEQRFFKFTFDYNLDEVY
jgi:hypothetical protein